MKADLAPDSHDIDPVPARLLIFPQYSPGARCSLGERPRAESFLFAAHHSFNYSLLGEQGFDAMATLIDSVQCYGLNYGDLDAAMASIERLHARVAAA
jgi:hypothetical protein